MSETPKTNGEKPLYPYRRPKDAATLILIDRSGRVPRVLVGRRHDKMVFMPGKLVFPGGSVEASDNRVPLARPMPDALVEKLCSGAPKTRQSRARAIATAAIREVCEETGLCVGTKVSQRLAADQVGTLGDEWKPFADAGLLPDPSQLFLIARAITPPGRVRRFDTRFFIADAFTIAHEVSGVVHADAELVELLWVELGAAPLADMHHITRRVLDELQARLAAGPLSHAAAVPFYHFRAGRMLRDMI